MRRRQKSRDRAQKSYADSSREVTEFAKLIGAIESAEGQNATASAQQVADSAHPAGLTAAEAATTSPLDIRTLRQQLMQGIATKASARAAANGLVFGQCRWREAKRTRDAVQVPCVACGAPLKGGQHAAAGHHEQCPPFLLLAKHRLSMAYFDHIDIWSSEAQLYQLFKNRRLPPHGSRPAFQTSRTRSWP